VIGPLAVLMSAAAMGAGAGPVASDPITGLKPRHWLEVPDSHLRKVAFKWPKGITYRRNSIGVAGVIICWCGGAYDTKRDRLIVWGGGHSAYAGNEIYVFDVRRLKWERVNDPSLNVDQEGRGETYKDGTPRSVHTYDYIEYIPSIDRFVSMGLSATYPSGVGGGYTTWCFDFDTKKWETKSVRPVKGRSGMCGSAFDPVTGHEFLHTRSGDLWEWDPPADKWTQLGKVSGHYGSVGALDPIGRRYMAIGGGNRTGSRKRPGQFYCTDISGRTKPKRRKIDCRGPDDILYTGHPGLDYDPVLDRLVGWGGGADVFLLDLEKMAWKKVEPAETNKVTPTDAVRAGTYGRFRYIPSMNAYIVVNSVDQNVYIYRLIDRAGEPVPERFKEALKSRDARLVKYVAGQVALWPEERSEAALKAGLDAQKQAGNAEPVTLLRDTLKSLWKDK